MASLAYRVADAKPNRLITLTVDTKLYTDPRSAFDQTRRKVADWTKVIRQHVPSFEYLRVLEVTKKGWPHYHFVVRSPFIKHAVLQNAWKALTGNLIVDVRMIHEGQGVYHYVVKYLGKQESVPWTKRRVCFSRKFFVPTEHKKHSVHQLCNKARWYKGVSYVLARSFWGHVAHELQPGMWAVVPMDDPFPYDPAIS